MEVNNQLRVISLITAESALLDESGLLEEEPYDALYFDAWYHLSPDATPTVAVKHV
jgi:hypothetical protein